MQIKSPLFSKAMFTNSAFELSGKLLPLRPLGCILYKANLQKCLRHHPQCQCHEVRQLKSDSGLYWQQCQGCSHHNRHHLLAQGRPSWQPPFQRQIQALNVMRYAQPLADSCLKGGSLWAWTHGSVSSWATQGSCAGEPWCCSGAESTATTLWALLTAGCSVLKLP